MGTTTSKPGDHETHLAKQDKNPDAFMGGNLKAAAAPKAPSQFARAGKGTPAKLSPSKLVPGLMATTKKNTKKGR